MAQSVCFVSTLIFIQTRKASRSQEVDGGDDELEDEAEEEESLFPDDSVKGDGESFCRSFSTVFSIFLILTSAAKAKAKKIKTISRNAVIMEAAMETLSDTRDVTKAERDRTTRAISIMDP